MASKNTIAHGNMVRQKIKEAIIEYMCKHGYSPTVKEIGDMVGLKSKSTVHNHLVIMFEQGMIETDCELACPRAIRVPEYEFVKKEQGHE